MRNYAKFLLHTAAPCANIRLTAEGGVADGYEHSGTVGRYAYGKGTTMAMEADTSFVEEALETVGSLDPALGNNIDILA